jgi:hypothetical protein
LVEVSQQPVGHDAELQTHWPPTHCEPAPQAALEPHIHAPLVQRSALVMSHALHVPVAGEPQALKLVVVFSHVDGDVQQPRQPLFASQTQVAAAPLPVHLVPAGQTSPVEPQTQAPLVHAFAVVESQVLQTPPGVVPQFVVSIVLWQLPIASQQPVGHDVASHTQPPLMQRWPAGHTVPPAPHEQLVPTQRSAVIPHAVQALPSVAQPTLGSGRLQVLPAQQPLPLHVVEQPVQTPLLHVFVMPVQGVQAPPPLPQEPFVVPSTHLPVTSQQFVPVHDVGSHTHAPPTQRWPARHWALPPQLQVPPVQPSAVMPQLIVAEHEPPPVPQCVLSMATQAVPLSHWLPAQPQLAPRHT